MHKNDLAHLIACTSLRMERLAQRTIFDPLNISSASLKILGFINHYEIVAPSQLVKKLGSTKSNITQRINLLARSGWVSKTKATDGDGRLVSLSLTDAGRAKLKEASDIMSRKYLTVEKIFTSQELKNFNNFINKLNNLITEYEQSI